MADGAPVTAAELASRTGTAPAYLRPWLANQAAGGYVEYDRASQTYSMTPEQVLALAVEDGPAFFAGSMQLALGVLRDVPAIEERSAPEPDSAFTSTTRTCSRAPSGSSGPATSPTWSRKAAAAPPKSPAMPPRRSARSWRPTSRSSCSSPR
jgi:hypothetical protein